MPNPVTNIVVAGLGGQGVLTATDVLADALLRAGFDVKKSELKGMSQRGGSVTSDVRFGEEVLSPMVAPGSADFLLVLEATQIEPNQFWLRTQGLLLTPNLIDLAALPNRKSLNVALLGALSAHLPVALDSFWEALRAGFPERLFEANRQAFLLGLQSGRQPVSLA